MKLVKMHEERWTKYGEDVMVYPKDMVKAMWEDAKMAVKEADRKYDGLGNSLTLMMPVGTEPRGNR